MARVRTLLTFHLNNICRMGNFKYRIASFVCTAVLRGNLFSGLSGQPQVSQLLSTGLIHTAVS